ncbi:MAG: FAD-linked oxidase C-terminal domain-containing protein [Acidimicrobiales bacterium]
MGGHAGLGPVLHRLRQHRGSRLLTRGGARRRHGLSEPVHAAGQCRARFASPPARERGNVRHRHRGHVLAAGAAGAGVRQAFHFPDFAAGLEAIRETVRQGWRPPVVRLYDGRESWRHFRDRLPKGDAMLIFLHEGPPGVAPLEADAVAGLCRSHGGTAAASEAVDGWFEHRNTVPDWDELLRQGVVADTIEVATEWSRLPALYRGVIDALEAVPGVVAASAHSSHAYRSGANLYFTVAATPADPADNTTVYDACWAAAMEATASAGAGLAHHHGIGRVRRPWMATELGDGGLELLRWVKAAVDPAGLMNPGVLIP